jgi:hypothetical protein
MLLLTQHPQPRGPALRDRNAEFDSQQQIREIRRRAEQVESMDIFNLITGPDLLERLEALLPQCRERTFTPTVTLAMFLRQVLHADSSCQNALDEAIINQLLPGADAVSANTAGYCLARQRLPLPMVQELARQTGEMMNRHTPQGWRWRGRHVKLTDGTTTLMPDTPQNQARFPQHGSQEEGAGFPIARLVSVMSLANWAVLDLALGPYQGKGTGEYGLFRELLGNFVAGDVMLADSYYCSSVVSQR